MITISLDEYGEFEKEDTKPLFIAGIIFDDQDDEKEEWTERNRIKSYYKRVIADSGGNFQYPEDLHSNGDKKRDREVIKLVKSKVQETLPEFITKGTYQGETLNDDCNGVQREHNKKLNHGLPILHKVPPKRDYGRYFCIMAEKGGTSHGGLTEKLSPFFHAKKQEVNAYGR